MTAPGMPAPAVDVESFLAQAMAKGLRPDPALKVSEWADKYRRLTTRSSPEPGAWRTSRTPYLKEPMDCLSPSSRVEVVVLMTGAQIGKTETGNNWIGFNIHQAPGPMVSVMPTTDMAQRNSKQRIAPLIEDCPALRSLVKESRSRDSGNTVLAKGFPGGILVMVGANSAKGLRSTSARYLFLDEVDGYPGDVDGEGEPCDLAMARTTNYARRKILITSTPVISGRSRIERFFERTDQCHFYVPCPHCEGMQVLLFEHLRWPKGEPRKATYGCEHCGGTIENHHKNYMLPRGEWRAHAEGGGKWRGFHLSSLYSPVGWLSWGEVAEKFDNAEGDREKLQVFWNTVLGLPWADQGEVPEVDRLYERREDYPIGKVPQGGLVLTAGADVQLKRIEVEIVAWGRSKMSWSVDYRVLEGDTQQPEIWQRLAEMLDEDFPTVYGQSIRIQKLAVDTGFNTLAVYDFVRKMTPLRVMGVKGDSRSSALVNPPSLVEVGPSGRRLKLGVRLWPLNVSIGKEQLYRRLKASVPDIQSGEQWPVGFCHFPQYSKEYFEQLCAEQLVTRIHNNVKKTVWEKRRDRNEALDARIYAMAAAAALRLDVWTPEKWDDLQATLTIERKSEPASAVKPVATHRLSSSPMPEFKSFKAKTDFSED
jgi:phage terminase large subunit GpA-like protein